MLEIVAVVLGGGDGADTADSSPPHDVTRG
jgi:hypothetical protein